MKYACLHTHRTPGRVARWCTALGVSRSGYYAWRAGPESRRARENRVLLTRIQAVHTEHREAYGAVKTWRVLRAQGVACGRHRVARGCDGRTASKPGAAGGSA